MYRARKKESPLAIDENGLSVVGNTTVNPLQLNTQPQRQTQQCKVHFGNWGGFHAFQANGECQEREERKGGVGGVGLRGMVLVSKEKEKRVVKLINSLFPVLSAE